MRSCRGLLRAVAIASIVLVGLPASAGFPRDPERTLERAQGGRIRVGVVVNEPWVIKDGDDATGVEAELVRMFARELKATPEWHWGGEQAHMEALEHHQLDLVIGGITRKTPWKTYVGLTDKYFGDHVIATGPGENAWIKRLDEFLARQRSAMPALLERFNKS